VLGVSSARPAHGRHVSGSVVDTPTGQIVVDCGEGFQERMLVHNSQLKACDMKQRLRHTRLRLLLLTHGHLDHCWGVLPMLQTMSLDGRNKPLAVAGPISDISFDALLANGANAILNDPGIVKVDLARQWQQWWSLGATNSELGYEITWLAVDFSSGERWLKLNPESGECSLLDNPPVLMDGVSVHPHETLHSVPSCGWSIRLADKAGRFEREKAVEMNLDSEQKRSLAAGKDIENKGELLKAEDFRGPQRVAPCVLISGDTGAGAPSFSSIEVGPTLLIHEATYTSERVDRARQWLHSTSQDAANAATEMSAKHLLLTHYSSRIEDTSQLLAEARDIHPSTAAAADGDIIKMDLEGGISHLRYDGRGWSQLHDSF